MKLAWSTILFVILIYGFGMNEGIIAEWSRQYSWSYYRISKHAPRKDHDDAWILELTLPTEDQSWLRNVIHPQRCSLGSSYTLCRATFEYRFPPKKHLFKKRSWIPAAQVDDEASLLMLTLARAAQLFFASSPTKVAVSFGCFSSSFPLFD